MAQKKLLFYVIMQGVIRLIGYRRFLKSFALGMLFLGFSFNANAEKSLVFNKEDIEFAKELLSKSRQIGIDGIKSKWLELQKIQQERMRMNGSSKMDIDQEFTINDYPLSATNKLRVFVSSSMGKELLKHYVNQAKNYGATLVFNGLPENSWRKLSELVYEITAGNAEGIEIQLDDVAFAEYGVTSVPTFVFSSEASVFDGEEIGATGNKFDKVSGNIGIRRALEEIVKHGDLSDKAENFLTKNGIRE